MTFNKHFYKSKWFLGSVLLILIIITSLITIRRSVKGSNDFDTFYQSGQAVLSGQGIYYTGEYYKTKDDIGPFLYPPPAACFFAFFAIFPLKLAAFLWNLMSIFLFFASLKMLLQIFEECSCGLDKAALISKSNIIYAMALLVVATALFFDNITMAQVNILIFFLCLVGVWLVKRSASFWGGLIFSIAIWIKVTPALFIFYFVVKRQWKAVAGILAGTLLLAVVLPVAVFGIENSRVYYRQWVGRTIKPGLTSLLSNFQHYQPHVLKKSPEALRMMRLGDMLVEKNQSLEASMTRVFLKNRNEYATESSFPIYVARRYQKLPVIAGGLSLEKLSVVIHATQFLILFLMVIFWWPGHVKNSGLVFLTEIGTVLISMTLLAPFARSHQLIHALAAFCILLLPRTEILSTLWIHLRKAGLVAAILYLMMALPYGRAAGFGTWANLTLWCALMVILAKQKSDRRLPTND